MNTEEIMAFFIKEKIGVIVYGGAKYVYPGKKEDVYKVMLEKSTNDLEIKVQRSAPIFEVAVFLAHQAWTEIVNHGVTNWQGQLIEHVKTPPSLYRPDEEIPF